jgi:hypothetical protein
MESSAYPSPAKPGKTSGFAIASLVCGFLGFLLLPGLFGVVFGIMAIRQINASGGTVGGKGLAIGGLVLSGITIAATGVIVLMARMLLPALGKAKAKANRMKCSNNLKQISSAHLSFTTDYDGFPWQLQPAEQQQHFGMTSGLDKTVGGIFGLEAMKDVLWSAKVLVSPCDPDRFAANDMLQDSWESYNTKEGSPMPSDGISYVLCEGADDLLPTTVLSLTRNLSSDDLANATWLGADSDPVNPNTMAGLNFSQGQLGRSDGSVLQSTNNDLDPEGEIVGDHINAKGGRSPENPSTRIFR